RESARCLTAQDKIGGRIESIPWTNNWVECGAQYLYGQQSDLAKICRYRGLLSDFVSTKGSDSYLRDDGVQVDGVLVKDINDVVQSAIEECKVFENAEIRMLDNAANVGRILRSKLRKHLRTKGDPLTIRDMREEIFDWNVRLLMIENACFTLDELSVKYWGECQPIGNVEHANFEPGYSSIIKFIAQGLNQRNIRLSCPVETIEWRQSISTGNLSQANAKPVTVTLADKRRIFADCVIATCSLGYLKENYKKMFNPELPLHLSQAIECLGFGLVNKIFLDFGEPWWGPNDQGFQFIWSKNGRRIFSKQKLATWTRDLTGFNILEGHRAVLLGQVAGRGAYIVETLSEHQVALDCINLLRHFLKREDISVPRRCKRTQWHSNMYIRGAYSHISTNCDATAVTPGILGKPVWCTVTREARDKCIPVIMLAGEATHEKYYSTTHGAFETGIRQAKTFLQYHIEKKC
ncbi:spermine oxidase-like, partial [Neodiprion pinetum]|uniref:spermine oxidase-like n=1 Tax=Neodiprion pinetum TaxID=441929 RepID=UPI003724BFB6